MATLPSLFLAPPQVLVLLLVAAVAPVSVSSANTCPTCAPAYVSTPLVSEQGFESEGPATLHDSAEFHSGLTVFQGAQLNGGASVEGGDITVRGTMRKGDGSPMFPEPSSGTSSPSGAYGSCLDRLEQNPGTITGEYDIAVGTPGTTRTATVRVRCDMDSMGGGWTEAGRINFGTEPITLRDSLTAWHDLSIPYSDPTEGYPQFHLPMSHFSDPTQAVAGEDVDVMFTSPNVPGTKVMLLGFNNRCMWGQAWQSIAMPDLSTAFLQKCKPSPRSPIPFLTVTDTGDIRDTCEARMLEQSSNRIFLHAECKLTELVNVFTNSGSSPGSMKSNVQAKLLGTAVTSLVWHVREHRKSRLTSVTAGVPFPNLLHRYKIGAGPITDDIGSIPQLLESGSPTRVADKCNQLSDGAIQLTSTSHLATSSDVPAIEYTGSFAVSFWIKPIVYGGSSTPQTIISYTEESAGLNGWAFTMQNDGTFTSFGGKRVGVGSAEGLSGPGLPAGVWTHVECGYERIPGGNGRMWISILAEDGRIVSIDETTGMSDVAIEYAASPVLAVGFQTQALASTSFESDFAIDDIQFKSEGWATRHHLKKYAEGSNSGPGSCPN